VSQSPSTIAIVLAAGRGERLGGPKVLLPWGDDRLPLGLAHARALRDPCARVVIVVRREVVPALIVDLPPHAELCISERDHALGPAGSIAAAIAAIDAPDAARVVLTPVDCPPACRETVALLLARLEGDDHPIAVRPKWQGRRGHPVVLCFGTLRSWYRDSVVPLRDRLRDCGSSVIDVELEDPRVVVDFDTLEDLSAYGNMSSRRG
jgi:molybdenum cofactor cytidylyltransferase